MESAGGRKRVTERATAEARILGSLLTEARDKVGLSQSEAARRLGWGQDYISRLEHGEYEASFFRIAAVAQLYGASMDAWAVEVRAELRRMGG